VTIDSFSRTLVRRSAQNSPAGEHGPLPKVFVGLNQSSTERCDPERDRSLNLKSLLGSSPLWISNEHVDDEQVEVCADLPLRASTCFGDEDDTDGLYHSVAKRGTTAFHAMTLYARVKNKRYTLAVRRLKDGDTAK